MIVPESASGKKVIKDICIFTYNSNTRQHRPFLLHTVTIYIDSKHFIKYHANLCVGDYPLYYFARPTDSIFVSYVLCFL